MRYRELLARASRVVVWEEDWSDCHDDGRQDERIFVGIDTPDGVKVWEHMTIDRVMEAKALACRLAEHYSLPLKFEDESVIIGRLRIVALR